MRDFQPGEGEAYPQVAESTGGARTQATQVSRTCKRVPWLAGKDALRVEASNSLVDFAIELIEIAADKKAYILVRREPQRIVAVVRQGDCGALQ